MVASNSVFFASEPGLDLLSAIKKLEDVGLSSQFHGYGQYSSQAWPTNNEEQSYFCSLYHKFYNI